MRKINEKGNVVGIFLGIFVLVAVGLVSVFAGKKSTEVSSTSSIETQGNQINMDNSSGTSAIKESIKPSASKSGFLPDDEEEGDDGDDDEGGGAPIAPTKTPTVTITPPVDTTKKSSVYKDGNYTATGTYMSPGGLDKIGVTLILKGDIVTSISLNLQPGDSTSEKYMNKFASGYQTYVLGKNIASVNLNVVSGSSLTPIGFNDALSKIKTQARV